MCYLTDLKTYYRPQRSCGEGNVFTGMCLSTGGGRVSASVYAGMPDPPRPGRHPLPRPGRHPPGTRQTPPQVADSSIRYTSGQYASYWNAYLFTISSCISFTHLISSSFSFSPATTVPSPSLLHHLVPCLGSKSSLSISWISLVVSFASSSLALALSCLALALSSFSFSISSFDFFIL